MPAHCVRRWLSRGEDRYMKARELMTAQPACCTPDDSLQHAAREMQGQDCGCIPIIEDQHDHRLVGLVTDRDIACRGVAAGMNPDTPLSQVMSPAPKSCDLDDDVETVERIMAEEQVRRVPVVDSRNRCVGIIAQADLALNRVSVSEDEVGRMVERISEPAPSWGTGTPTGTR